MSPTVVLDDEGRVVAVVGASGGTKITTSVAQVVRGIYIYSNTMKDDI